MDGGKEGRKERKGRGEEVNESMDTLSLGLYLTSNFLTI